MPNINTTPNTPTIPTPTILQTLTLNPLTLPHTFKNYKALCSYFSLTPSTGHSKMAQIKELQRYFSLTKNDGKQSYTLSEIYPNPLPKQDKRSYGNHSTYSKHIEMIIMLTLKQLYYKYGDTTLDTSRNQTLFHLNMVNKNYISLCKGNYVKDVYENPSLFITKTFVNNFITVTKNRLNSILTTSLDNMAKRGLIVYKDILCTSYKHNDKIMYREITHEENEKIEQIKQSILSEMGLQNIPLPYSKQYREYQNRQNIRVMSELGIERVFKKYIIEPATNIEAYNDIDTDNITEAIITCKNELNNAIVSCLTKQLTSSVENSDTLDDDGKERIMRRNIFLINETIKNVINNSNSDNFMNDTNEEVI